jgi:predicted ArsR family transcriptional regulator
VSAVLSWPTQSEHFWLRRARASAPGGAARIEKEETKLIIRSSSCPLAAAVSEHPEVCQLAEALMTEIVGVPVQERCDRDGPSQCRFEIKKAD